MEQDKIVEFGPYCPTCEHYELPEEEEPCYYCLGHSTNVDSHRPVYYSENPYLPKKIRR